MPLRPEPLIFSRNEGSYYERLQRAFSLVGKDKPILIILDYDYRVTTSEEIKVAKAFSQRATEALPAPLKTDTSNPRTENLLVGIESVKACLRPRKTPLLWFDSDYEYLRH